VKLDQQLHSRTERGKTPGTKENCSRRAESLERTEEPLGKSTVLLLLLRRLMRYFTSKGQLIEFNLLLGKHCHLVIALLDGFEDTPIAFFSDDPPGIE
jgi:hypothetical protein